MQATSSPYLITPLQTQAAAKQAGLTDEQLGLSGMAILTFSKAVVDRLAELCNLEDTAWISQRCHPYAAAEIVKRGEYQGVETVVLVPPASPSPISCILEDLIACGARAVFLVCAAWSLGPPVEFGDLIIPSYSIGMDGTSAHYGNMAGEISADPQVVEALTKASRKQDVRTHVGGNATCEALYRITPQMVSDFRQQGCVCMENGEASTLFAVTQELGVFGGALFQPYIDLQKGWNPAMLDERYRAVSRIQAEVILEAGLGLLAK
jgi:uridine phosphorylase